MRVSVVCPTYNRSQAIRSTLASVARQAFPDWELLVASDGSTDDTDDVVRAVSADEPRIRLIRTEPHGDPSEPRNIALAQASGDIVAYLDHDDRFRPDHLQRVVDLVDGGADLVAMGNVYRDGHGIEKRRSSSFAMCWHPELQLLSAMFETSRVSHRRELVDEAGGWRVVPGFEDWDLWQRMTDHGHRFTTVNEHTVRMLARDGSRRHTIPSRYRLPLVVFDEPDQARLALSELESDRHTQRLRAASIVDMRAWLARLMESPDFVRPNGWSGDPVRHHVQRVTKAHAPVAGLVVSRHADGWALAQPLHCPTADHADRIVAAAHRDRPTLLGEVQAITAPFGARFPHVRPVRTSGLADLQTTTRGTS